MKENCQTRLFTQLGWVVALWLLVPTGIGLGLDNWLATSPLLAALGGLIGVVAASVNVVRMTTHSMANMGKSPGAQAQDDMKDKEGEGSR
jgi:F0F1-type ATP synthase assembly protein I